MLLKLGLSMEGATPERRRTSSKGQAGSGETSEVEHAQEAELGSDSRGGTVAMRVFHRPMDGASCGGGDRKTFWDPVPPQPHVETPGGIGVELPEAPEAGPGTGREGHRALEALPVAAYKKRPSDLEPIWSSSTRAGSCSSLTWSEPGLRSGRHPGCRWRADGPRSLPSRPLASPPNESVWPCMHGSISTRTSGPLRWPTSFGTSCAISPVRWSCCGIGDRSTGPDASNGCWTATGACIPIPSPAMLPSLTRTSSSGLSSNAPWPTAFLRTRIISNDSSSPRSNGCADPSGSCGLASMGLNYHGLRDSYYLCVTQ